MKSRGPRVLVRSALVALAALVLVGWIHSVPSAPLVRAGTDELGTFAVVDMGDALERVVGGSEAAQPD